VPLHTLTAFTGALGAIGLVYLMSRLRPGRDMARLLLAGISVAYLCSAGILLVFFLADKAITNDIVVWTMGSLGVLRPRAALEIAVVLLPVLACCAAFHRRLDLLALGDHLAAARGVPVAATVWTCYVLVGLLTAAIVANCGPIGFVGLMVPHIGRALFGVRTLPLLAGAALVGAGFLAACDGVARSARVTELPVGIVTNMLGAGFFIYLLATRDVGGRTPG
jgi:iron complex transport system permease protein